MTVGDMVFVSLGRGFPENDELWRDSRHVRDVVRFEGAASSGRRLGSRAFGLGIDSAVVAIKVLLGGHRGPYLAVNPWVGAALKLVGKRDVRVTGVYAQAGSRSFRILRALLGHSMVVTTVKLEADAWNGAGGNAASVLYGNSFHYPKHIASDSEQIRVFIGGSSDRDLATAVRLEDEIRASALPISLTIASDEPPSCWSRGAASITRTGRVSPAHFGELVAASDVVFLPLKDSKRAAGHMVTVGALESGVAVVSSRSSGMEGYVDGEFVTWLDPAGRLIPQLVLAAEVTRSRSEEITMFWAARFSLAAYIDRVGSALAEIAQRK